MAEKIKEFEINVKFTFSADMTVEFATEKEAINFARNHFIQVCRDHLRDKDNICVTVKKAHTISLDERNALERDGIIEPVSEKQRAILEKNDAKEKKAKAREEKRLAKEAAAAEKKALAQRVIAMSEDLKKQKAKDAATASKPIKLSKSSTIRIGEGKSDKDCKWFTGKDEAIKYAKETKKNIYVSINMGKYQPITLKQLIEAC